MNWIHTRDFKLMEKTLDENMTAKALISGIADQIRTDPVFTEFNESIEGDQIAHFVEDVDADGLDEHEQTERANELLNALYDYADSERIAL